MKIQYITSACVIVEHNNVKVLCDPWLTDGIYYGSWYHYPPLKVGAEAFHDVDYIYLTHIHPDHCDVASLKTFPKQIPVLIHQYEEKFLLRLIKSLGFENIIEVEHKVPFKLGEDFVIEILAADNCDPAMCGRWFSCHVSGTPTNTLQIDSLAVFAGGGQVVVNTNDCPFSLTKLVCDYVRQKYPKIDFLLVGYSGAGPYPQCFKNLKDEEKIVAAEAKKKQFLEQSVSYLEMLKPAYFLPFAGQYTLGGTLSHLNRYRGVPELETLAELFPPLLERGAVASKMILLNSLEFFDIDSEKASSEFIPPNANEREAYVRDVLNFKKYAYENFEVTGDTFFDLYDKIVPAFQHMRSKLIFYNFSTPTHVYFDVGLESIFSIPFNGQELSVIKASEIKEPFVLIQLHPGLLEMILTRKAHFNNAEIGSHLTFYRSPNVYERGIYNFLSYLN